MSSFVEHEGAAARGIAGYVRAFAELVVEGSPAQVERRRRSRAGALTASRIRGKLRYVPRGSSSALHAAEAPAVAEPSRDTTFFFVLAFALTWLPLLPPSLAALGVLSGAPEEYMAGAPLAVFAPAIAAIVAARREGGWPAVRALLRGLRAFRVSPIWFLLAVALPGLIFTAGRAALELVPGVEGGPWLYPPEQPEHVAALLLVPIGEEIGWRGFALPRLLARHGAHRGGTTLGLLWALWHVPMFVSVGQTAPQVVVGLVFIAAGNVMFTWFYRRTGGSLLLAVLLHFGAHLDAPTRALPANATPLHALTLAYVVVAIALVTLDRRAFEGRTPEAPGTAPALR